MNKSVLAAIGEELTDLRARYRTIHPLPRQGVRAEVEQIDSEFVPVLLSEGWINGLGHLRALGRNGVKAIVADPNPKALSFYSRFAIPYQCKPYHCSAAGFSESAFIEEACSLGDLIRSLGKKPVLFVIDAEPLLPMIARHLDEFSSRFLLTSNIPLQLKLEDKKVQLENAVAAGVDIPDTFFIDSCADLEAHCSEFHFPLLIKARAGKEFYNRFHFQAMRVTGMDELMAAYERFSGWPIILQEEIPGPDSLLYTLGSYVGRDCKPIGLFTGHKIRSNRPFGTCAMGISCDCPDVLEQGLAFLRQACYHGASQVEFKRDPRDGRLKFLEINNRLWKWHSLTEACGVNLPYLQYLDAIGGDLPAEPPQQVNGVRWWLTLADLWTAKNDIAAGKYTWKEYLQEVDLDFVDAVGSWDDPLPALVNFFRFGWMS